MTAASNQDLSHTVNSPITILLVDDHTLLRSGVKLLLQRNPQFQMLTVSENAAALGAALRAGARGYLLKNIEAEQLAQAIRRASAGESVIADAMTAKLVSQFRAGQSAPEADYEKLTPREREAMACLARGQSNKEIARQLDVAESTVKIHVQNILKKLKLTSRVQIAVYAVERNLGK